MSKQLLSNTQQRIQKSIKNIETFDCDKCGYKNIEPEEL